MIRHYAADVRCLKLDWVSAVTGRSFSHWPPSMAGPPGGFDILVRNTICSATHLQTHEKTDMRCSDSLAEMMNGCPEYTKYTHTVTKVKFQCSWSGFICAHYSPQNEFWSAKAATDHGSDVAICMLVALCHVRSKGTCPGSQLGFGVFVENYRLGSQPEVSRR